MSAPNDFEFNVEIGVDVLEFKDAAGRYYDVFNAVDYGTTLQHAFIVREGDHNGVPRSAACLDAFVKGWVRPRGWPKANSGDRGLDNRGIFGQRLARKGIGFNPAGSPEQTGRVERRNQMLKH